MCYRFQQMVSLVVVVVVALLGTGCFLQQQEAQQLVSDVPYVDGARYLYDVQGPDGQQIGEASFVTRKDSLEETPVWVIGTRTNIPGTVEEETEVYAHEKTLRPVRFAGTTTVSKGTYEITADYQEDEVIIEAETPDGSQDVTRPKPDNAYDNDQLLMLLRAVPFEKDYTAEFTLVLPKNANKVSGSVKVVGQETVTVPAGEFQAWKLQLKFGGSSQKAWYCMAGTHPLIKYTNPTTTFVLKALEE